MNLSTLPRLAAVLQTIRNMAPGGFSFDAMWIGESPKEERRVTIDELLALVEQSQLGTRTRYLVG
jgi:hypothetical protein